LEEEARSGSNISPPELHAGQMLLQQARVAARHEEKKFLLAQHLGHGKQFVAANKEM
jgi:hypothetical protein